MLFIERHLSVRRAPVIKKIDIFGVREAFQTYKFAILFEKKSWLWLIWTDYPSLFFN